MKTSKSSLLSLLILFSFIFIGLLFLDFLALNDIHNDYVSNSVLEGINAESVIDKLPNWSSTKGEWIVIQTSMLGKLMLGIANIFILLKLTKLKTA